MLEVTPAWSFTARFTLTQWYGHVHLLPSRVLGQWFCLDRSDGRVLWERRFCRPDTIREVAGPVIIASETRSDGPWTASFGCYGISLETGELLWTSHAAGMWGRLLRFLDFVPGFTNELRDAPDFVQSGEVVCASGRVLDVHTGRDIRRLPAEEVKKHERLQSEAALLYHGRLRNAWTKIRLANGSWLSHKARPEEDAVIGFRLYILGEDGSVQWDFDLATTGYHLAGNYYSYRYAVPYLYLVVSEERQLRDVPARPGHVLPNPAVYRLLTLNLNSTSVIQDFRVEDGKVKECRIEDVDEAGLLVSLDRRHLRYYERRQTSLPWLAAGGGHNVE
jgi:hypothetical protein